VALVMALGRSAVSARAEEMRARFQPIHSSSFGVIPLGRLTLE
jgi:hypothetical protein